MHKLSLLVILIFTGLVAACSPVQWDVSLVKNAEIVWPPEPEPAKVRYIGEFQKFIPITDSIVTKIFGRDNNLGVIRKPVALAKADDGRIAIVDSKLKGIHVFQPHGKSYQLLTEFAGQRIVSPVSVVFDDNLNMYVSDSVLRVVLVFDRNCSFTGILELPGLSNFVRPTGLAFDQRKKSLYVLDTTDNKIHEYAHGVNYIDSFGSRGEGQLEFNYPTHITVDTDGRLYVVDTMNFRIQVYDGMSEFVTSFGHHGNGSGDFSMSKGIAVDTNGTIYIVETLFDRIQLFNLQGDYLLNIGSKGDGPAEFWLPSGIFIDRENILYLCDTYNHRIQMFELLNGEKLQGGGP